MCRFVPFWLRILQSAGIDPVGILVFRNPADVASSLAERDGLLPQFSLLMWLRHMLDAERFTRMIPRAVVEYRDLLSDWRREVSPNWCEYRGRVAVSARSRRRCRRAIREA